MPRLRRFTALIVSLFLGQLMLVEAGFACAAPASMQSMAMGDASMAGMPGMARGDAELAESGDAHGSNAHGSSVHTAAAATPTDGPAPACDFPWAPNGCQSMVPCAPPTLGEAHAASLALPTVESEIARLDVLTPPSLLTPPELPPPRA